MPAFLDPLIPPMNVCPYQKYWPHPEQAGTLYAASLEIQQEGEYDAQKKDRKNVRSNMKMKGAGSQGKND